VLFGNYCCEKYLFQPYIGLVEKWTHVLQANLNGGKYEWVSYLSAGLNRMRVREMKIVLKLAST